MKRFAVLLSALVFVWNSAATATEVTKTPQPPSDKAVPPHVEHIVFMPGDIKWQDAPPSLPKGAKLCALEGNLSAPESFTFRVMLPDGYKVPPHWHPAMEHVTVLQGTLYLGKGDKWDESVAKAFPVGSFSAMPPQMHHFAWAKGETVIQVHGVGPWGITYVNPSDDPRSAPSASSN